MCVNFYLLYFSKLLRLTKSSKLLSQIHFTCYSELLLKFPEYKYYRELFLFYKFNKFAFWIVIIINVRYNMDLTRCWRRYPGAETTRRIYIDWCSNGRDNVMQTRLGRSLLHGDVSGCGELEDTTSFRDTEIGWCRRGCNVPESLEHLILDCPWHRIQRARMRKVCLDSGIRFGIIEILTD